MPVEETEFSSGQAGQFTTVRRNALGARGIDRIETVTTQGTSVSYPVYDGHGNVVAMLAKQGAGYQIGNRRSFGAWGDVRQGATTGDPKGRYCANLGHLDDDESGLTYMRARYYEASSGRFISEDRHCDGFNWYAYCGNDPVNFVDESGNAKGEVGIRQLLALFAAGGGFFVFASLAAVAMFEGAAAARSLVFTACFLYGIATACANPNWKLDVFLLCLDAAMGKLIDTVLAGAEAGKRVGGQATAAILAVTAYSLILIAELMFDFSVNGAPLSD